jgi:hypothetical protein
MQRYGGFGGFANISQTFSRSCDDTGSDLRQTADEAAESCRKRGRKDIPVDKILIFFAKSYFCITFAAYNE